jgi:hypothetical protein
MKGLEEEPQVRPVILLHFLSFSQPYSSSDFGALAEGRPDLGRREHTTRTEFSIATQ